MSDQQEHIVELDRVIAHYLEQEAAGGAVDRAALMEQHRPLATELNSFFQLHDQMISAASHLECRSATKHGATEETRADGLTETGETISRRPREFGDYLLLEEIGRGGMGVVFRARHVGLERTVALKILPEERLVSTEDVQRFLLESRAAARLDHPGIIQIYDSGELDGVPFYSMNYVGGQSLAQRLDSGPLEPDLAARLMASIAEAVHYAHQQQVLHRDLKPSNILLDASGAPKIADFGLARYTATSDLTVTGQILGTPGYMAPEQAAAEDDLGPAVDVYSLGATLYALLTGRPPFQSASLLDTLVQVCNRQPVAPRELNPLVPQDLQTICLKCLEKSPGRRYASAKELAQDLQRHLNGQTILARPAGPLERGARWIRRNPMVATWALSALSILMVATVSLLVLVLQLQAARNQAELHAAAASKAERQRTEQLWTSYLDQARARRWSGRDGRRFASLEVLRQAAALHPSLALRNEAIAALSLPDLRFSHRWDVSPDQQGGGLAGLVLDAAGQRYARSDEFGNISVRTVADNQELAHLPSPGAEAWGLKFSPDGRFLAANYETPGGRLSVWDLTTQSEVFQLSESVNGRAVDFDPQSRWVAFAIHDSVRFHGLPAGEPLRSFSVTPTPQDMAVDPSGNRVALSNTAGFIEVLEVNTGAQLCRTPRGPLMNGLAWHPYREVLAGAGTDFKVHQFEADTGKRLGTLSGHLSQVTAVAYSRGDGRVLASYGWDNTIRLWDHEAGEALVHLPNVVISGWPTLSFSPDNRRLGYGLQKESQQARLVEVATADLCTPLYTQRGRPSSVRGMAFSPDGSILATGAEALYLWSVGERKLLAVNYERDAASLAWTRRGDAILGSSLAKGDLNRWRVTTKQEGPELHWRIGVTEPVPGCQSVRKHAETKDGRLLAVGAVGRASILPWNQTGLTDSPAEGVRELPTDDTYREVASIAISSDGALVAGGAYQSEVVLVWSGVTGELLRRLSVLGANRSAIAFSPDGEHLVTGGLHKYEFHDLRSWRVTAEIRREGGAPSIAYSPDGRIIAATYSDQVTLLLDAQSLRELARLESPSPGLMVGVVFSPDGSYLAVATENRAVYLWNLKKLQNELAQVGLNWETPAMASEKESSPVSVVEFGTAPYQPARAEQMSTFDLFAAARQYGRGPRCGEALRPLRTLAERHIHDPSSIEFRLAMLWQGPLIIQSQGREAYDEHCRKLLDHFRDEQNIYLLEPLSRTCLLAPPSDDNLQAAARIAADVHDQSPNAWTKTDLALAMLRQGRLDESREYCQAVLELKPIWFLTIEARLTLSLIDIQQRRLDEARRELQLARDALAAIAAIFPDGPDDSSFPDGLICETLLREAATALHDAESEAAGCDVVQPEE